MSLTFSKKNGWHVDRGGTKRWYLNGKRHREDGPAIEYPDGTKVWYLNDELHREDGPAVEYPDGTKSWYLNGKKVDQLVHWITTKERKVAQIKAGEYVL